MIGWMGTAKGIFTGIMLLAALIGIGTFLAGWWNWDWWPNSSTAPPVSNQPESSSTNIRPTSTPTPIQSLQQMLETAQSVNSYAERNKALRIVAEAAVRERDYPMAIRAAAASPTYSARAETLVIVARCAIKEGLFDFAEEAASKIPTYSIEDSTKLEILLARTKESSQSATSSSTPMPMSCPW